MNIYLLVISYSISLLLSLYCYNHVSLSQTSINAKSQTPEQMCEKILEITSSANESKIIINERNGGLGHKSISTVGEIIYALILKKQLWCMRFVFVIS